MVAHDKLDRMGAELFHGGEVLLTVCGCFWTGNDSVS